MCFFFIIVFLFVIGHTILAAFAKLHTKAASIRTSQNREHVLNTDMHRHTHRPPSPVTQKKRPLKKIKLGAHVSGSGEIHRAC